MSNPLILHKETIRKEWVDYNGHMNVAYYVLVFDHATDALLDYVGMDEAYRARTAGTVFVVESHITYEREVMQGTQVEISTRILDVDDKRLHFFHSMREPGSEQIAATIEIMLLHVDLNSRKTAAFPAEFKSKFSNLANDHSKQPRPPQVGRQIGIKKKA